MPLKNFLTFVLSICFCVGYAQESNYVVDSTSKNNNLPEFAGIEISLHGATPHGEFKEAYPKKLLEGLSLGFILGLSPTKNKIHVGAEVGYFYLSKAVERYNNLYHYEIGDYDLKTKIRGRMVPLHFLVRYVPFYNTRSKVQPFVEGMAGLRILSATQVFKITTDAGEVLERDYSSDNSAIYSYGYSGGFMFRTGDKDIILKVSKIHGSETLFMDPSTVEPTNDMEFTYEKFRARMDVVSITLGLNFNF